MEGLAPPLKCLIEIQTSLQNGESVRVGLLRYMNSSALSDELGQDARRFLFAWDQDKQWRLAIAKLPSPYRRALFELIAQSLAGQPILSHLDDLKCEIIAACDLEVRHHIEMLPMKMLIPLLIFQFPAFLLLLFGPLLNELIRELQK